MSWMNLDYLHDLQSFLGLNELRQSLVAANIANMDTPGYKSLGFNFQQALRRAEAQPGDLPGGPQAAAEIAPVPGLLARPDGNNVNMDRAGLLMAKTQLEFHLGIALLTKEFQRIQSAIRGAAS